MRIANTKQTVTDMLDSENKQSGYRCLTVVFAGYEEPLTVNNFDSTGQFEFTNQSVNGWIALIKKRLFANPSVEDIFVTIEKSDVDVWVVIAERDLSVLGQLVEKEEQIIETLVSGENPALLIDFHVIYRCGRNIEDLVSNRAIQLPK